MTHLLWIIIKVHPELITSAQVDRLFAWTKYHLNATRELTLVFEVLAVITNTRPHLFHNYNDLLVHFVNDQQNSSIFDYLQAYFVASTIVGGEQTATDSVALLINCIKKDIEATKDIRLQLVYICQLIGTLSKKALEYKRQDLSEYDSYPECQVLLDFIDGRSTNHTNEIVMNRIQEHVTQIEQHLFKTKRDIQQITKPFSSAETNVSDQLLKYKRVGIV